MNDCADTEFDHHTDEFVRDPYSKYRQLRSKCPVSFSGMHGGFWLLPRYDDVKQVLLDPGTYSSAYPGRVAIPNTTRKGATPMIPIEVDPPNHRHYREQIASFFSKSSIDGLNESAIELADSIVDRFVHSGSCELVKEFAEPFFSKLLAMFLKLPVEDSDHWIRWAGAIFAGRITNPGAAEEARQELVCYVDRLLDERRQLRRDDLFTALLDIRLNGEPLNGEELRGYGMEILLAGREATIDGISNSIGYLGGQSDAQEILAKNPEVLPTAIEEFLRWDSPIQLLGRVATRDICVHGKNIGAGASVAVMYGAANRDESKFNRADECILDRKPNPHLAFGLGPHTCIGMHLARLGIHVAISTIIKRLSPFSLSSEVEAQLKPNGDARGYLNLTITF